MGVHLAATLEGSGTVRVLRPLWSEDELVAGQDAHLPLNFDGARKEVEVGGGETEDLALPQSETRSPSVTTRR